MKYSPKGNPPESFLHWLSRANENWTPTYGNLQNPEIRDVRNALLAEQEYVCCYCGRELKDDQSDSHLDHFRPRSIYNGIIEKDLTLSFENFVASCGPPDRNGFPSTCGDAKADKFDKLAFVEPWDPACEQRFIFGSTGFVQSSDSEDQGAQRMITFLNLDHESLRQERSLIIAAIEEDIKSGAISDIKMEIERLRRAHRGKRIGFSHVAARYLELEFAPTG